MTAGQEKVSLPPHPLELEMRGYGISGIHRTTDVIIVDQLRLPTNDQPTASFEVRIASMRPQVSIISVPKPQNSADWSPGTTELVLLNDGRIYSFGHSLGYHGNGSLADLEIYQTEQSQTPGEMRDTTRAAVSILSRYVLLPEDEQARIGQITDDTRFISETVRGRERIIQGADEDLIIIATAAGLDQLPE